MEIGLYPVVADSEIDRQAVDQRCAVEAFQSEERGGIGLQRIVDGESREIGTVEIEGVAAGQTAENRAGVVGCLILAGGRVVAVAVAVAGSVAGVAPGEQVGIADSAPQKTLVGGRDVQDPGDIHDQIVEIQNLGARGVPGEKSAAHQDCLRQVLLRPLQHAPGQAETR